MVASQCELLFVASFGFRGLDYFRHRFGYFGEDSTDFQLSGLGGSFVRFAAGDKKLEILGMLIHLLQ